MTVSVEHCTYLRETDYLLRSPRNAQHLRASIDMLEASDKWRLIKGIRQKAFSRLKTPFTPCRWRF
ncbi:MULTISPECIES: hypothetical protein [Corynebacterium]|uniref:hypothetical protein n=1 Tax=Corynebacterium TaxID=1716 RepID=UPI00114C8EF4|nr:MULTISPECIES: hypothetical protein [Corynebacterium]